MCQYRVLLPTQLVTTFACFEKKELLRYLFYILDPNRTGLVEKVFCDIVAPIPQNCMMFFYGTPCTHQLTTAQTELKHFVHNMWENKPFKNITDGLNYLDSVDDGDGAFNLKQLEEMQARYPMMMAPLYRLQVCIKFSQNTSIIFSTNFLCTCRWLSSRTH